MRAIVAFYLFGTFICLGQNHFNGCVLNQISEPVPSANVILLSLPDSTLLKGAISNDKGEFSIPKPIENKKLLLKITHIEYQDEFIPINNNYELGTITLQPAINELGEVVVSVSRPILKQKGTTLISNISETSLKHLPTIDKVIDFLPGIIQNSSTGKREIFGKGNPIYFINNQRVYDYSKIFRISPQDIENIELETQPGAEFDNSVGAIIRIRLKKKQGDGFSGTIWQLGDFRFNGSVYENGYIGLNYRTGNTDISFGMNHTSRFNTYSETEREFLVNTPNKGKIVTLENSKNNSKSGNTGISVAHEFNRNHSAGVNFWYDISPYAGNITTHQTIKSFQNNTLFEGYENKHIGSNRGNQISTNAYYEGKISENIKMKTDINYNNTLSNNTTNIDEKNIITNTLKNNTIFSETRSDWLGLTTTFSQKIGKVSTNYGVDFSTLTYKSNYNDAVLSSSNIENKELRSAGFIAFNTSLKKIELKGGVRYEFVDFEYFTERKKDFSKSRKYGHFLPNISVSFPLDNTNLSFSYSKKIRRPTFSELGDFLTYTSTFLYTKGNPNLVPQVTDEFYFLGTYKKFSSSLTYSYVKNGIFQDYQLYVPNPNIIEQSTRNFGDFHSVKLLLTGYHQINFWHPKLTFSVTKHFFKNNIFQNNTHLFECYLDNQFYFSENWSGSFSFEFTSKGRRMNGYHHKPYFYSSVGLQRLLCNKKLFLNISIIDIFGTDEKNITLGNHLLTDKTFTNYKARSFRFSLVYNFNSTQSKYKGQGISEDEKNRL